MDGLDEYASGTPNTENCQWDLAAFLEDISDPRSKLCIASCPEKVFLTAFAQIPSLMMQDRNFQGIYKYVDLTLQRSLASSGFYEDEELVSLSKSIATRSEGVFLWAHFAMNQLRNGWARADDLDMPSLRKKLDEVPLELDEIYLRIFRNLRPDDRRSVGHMLQLICSTRRELSLDELWVAMERAGGRAMVALTARRLKRFEQRVYAITGGILDIFWTERKTIYKNDTKYGYHLPDIDDNENEEDKHEESIDDGNTYEKDVDDESLFSGDENLPHYIGRGDPVVVLIHRTVQDFLDSQWWSEIVESTEDVALQSENLWLRVCVEELCSLANAADSTITAADSIVATLEKPSKAHTSNKPWYARDTGEVRRFRLPEDNATNSDGSTSFMDENDLEKYLDQRTFPLQQYAALFMLDHARTVEDNASISLYSIIQASMTTSFLELHAYNWAFLGYSGCSHCKSDRHLPRPAHPLHLAVAHGLNSYISEYLTSNNDRPLPETYISLTPFLAISTLGLVDFHS